VAKPKRPAAPGRRVEANGRSKEDRGFVRLNHWMLKSAAFKALDPFEVRILVELYNLYNGRNNGYLFLSCREAAERCNMGKNKAGTSFHHLIELGFIRRRADEPENYNLREANHWILTEFDFGKIAATKDFMSWQPPPDLKSRPLSKTSCPSLRTKEGAAANENEKASLIRDKNSG
jgi:hypothetical protein